MTGEEERLERVLPLVRKYGAAVVAISNDDTGISDGPGRPVRGRQADRRAGRRPRHPALGHHHDEEPASLVMPVHCVPGWCWARQQASFLLLLASITTPGEARSEEEQEREKINK